MKMLKKTAAAILVSSMIAGAAQAEISNDEVRIGYLADMSGTYRDLSGPGGLEALQMAIEDFGGTVNGKKIVTFNADDLNKPDVGANTVRQWIDERNVDMVTGMVASSVVLAAAKVVEQGGKLALISGAAVPALPLRASLTSTARKAISTGPTTPSRWQTAPPMPCSRMAARAGSSSPLTTRLVTPWKTTSRRSSKPKVAAWSARYATHSRAATSPPTSSRPRVQAPMWSRWPTPVQTR